jgi:MSHA biogenesis protein MshN
MSLINKMLQDLDARGGGAARGPDPSVRPVEKAPRHSRVAIVAGAAAGVLLAAFAGVAWYFLHTEPPAAPVPLQARAPVAPAPKPAPAVDAAVPPAVAPAPAAPEPVAATAPTADVPAAAPAAALPASAPAADAPVTAAAAAPANSVDAPVRAPRPHLARERARTAPMERPVEAVAAASPAPSTDAGQNSQGQAENAYRRALAALQDGRVADGIAGLERAIYLYPRHEAARQTLVGLLLEAGRGGEAQQHMQLGLSLNPNQPQVAMLLARLQLEGNGAAAVETLRRSLPFATGSAEYLAFLAGALQRQQRHHEAIDQYQAALRLAPQNGVWWMGLGMSLQAERRNTEARTAFTRAREAGLTPELQGFVERKLGQLE